MHFLPHSFLFDDAAGDAGSGGNAGAGSNGQGQQQDAGSSAGAFDMRQHLDDAGSFRPGWAKALGLPDTIEKKFTRPDALAKSYATLEKQIGAKGVIIPGPNATDAERAAYYKALGRPDTPEGYEFKKPDRIGEREIPAEAWDEARSKKWQTFFHELGVSKDQASKIVERALLDRMEDSDGITANIKQAQELGIAELKKVWGDANFDTNVAAARRAALQFGGDELVNHPALGNDPVLIKALAKIGQAMGEKQGTAIREGLPNMSVTPADARQQARELTARIAQMTKADRNWSNSPEAQRLKAEKTRLFQIANSEE